MLTKKQLQDLAKNYGMEVTEGDIPAVVAARAALAYREMLEKLESSLQWLKETIHDLDYKAWAEDNIGKIDALLGGKEDV